VADDRGREAVALVVEVGSSRIHAPSSAHQACRSLRDNTPDRLQGRTNAIFRLIVWGSQPLGIALAGVMLERLGPDRTIWILFVPQLLIALAITGHAGLRRAGWAE